MAIPEPFQGFPSWNAWDVSKTVAGDPRLLSVAEHCLKYEQTMNGAVDRFLQLSYLNKTADGSPFTATNVKAALENLSQGKLPANENVRQALELRAQGMSNSRIAQTMKLTRQAVHAMIGAAPERGPGPTAFAIPEVPPLTEFGAFLAAFRARHHKTQAQLARDIGLVQEDAEGTSGTISRWESGRGSSSMAIAIMRLLMALEEIKRLTDMSE